MGWKVLHITRSQADNATTSTYSLTPSATTITVITVVCAMWNTLMNTINFCRALLH